MGTFQLLAIGLDDLEVGISTKFEAEESEANAKRTYKIIWSNTTNHF